MSQPSQISDLTEPTVPCYSLKSKITPLSTHENVNNDSRNKHIHMGAKKSI